MSSVAELFGYTLHLVMTIDCLLYAFGYFLYAFCYCSCQQQILKVVSYAGFLNRKLFGFGCPLRRTFTKNRISAIDSILRIKAYYIIELLVLFWKKRQLVPNDVMTTYFALISILLRHPHIKTEQKVTIDVNYY